MLQDHIPHEMALRVDSLSIAGFLLGRAPGPNLRKLLWPTGLHHEAGLTMERLRPTGLPRDVLASRSGRGRRGESRSGALCSGNYAVPGIVALVPQFAAARP